MGTDFNTKMVGTYPGTCQPDGLMLGRTILAAWVPMDTGRTVSVFWDFTPQGQGQTPHQIEMLFPLPMANRAKVDRQYLSALARWEDQVREQAEDLSDLGGVAEDVKNALLAFSQDAGAAFMLFHASYTEGPPAFSLLFVRAAGVETVSMDLPTILNFSKPGFEQGDVLEDPTHFCPDDLGYVNGDYLQTIWTLIAAALCNVLPDYQWGWLEAHRKMAGDPTAYPHELLHLLPESLLPSGAPPHHLPSPLTRRLLCMDFIRQIVDLSHPGDDQDEEEVPLPSRSWNAPGEA